MAERILSVRQAGILLGVSNVTVKNLIKRGELRGFQVGAMWKVEYGEIQRYIQQKKEDAALFRLEPEREAEKEPDPVFA